MHTHKFNGSEPKKRVRLTRKIKLLNELEPIGWTIFFWATFPIFLYLKTAGFLFGIWQTLKKKTNTKAISQIASAVLKWFDDSRTAFIFIYIDVPRAAPACAMVMDWNGTQLVTLTYQIVNDNQNQFTIQLSFTYWWSCFKKVVQWRTLVQGQSRVEWLKSLLK